MRRHGLMVSAGPTDDGKVLLKAECTWDGRAAEARLAPGEAVSLARCLGEGDPFRPEGCGLAVEETDYGISRLRWGRGLAITIPDGEWAYPLADDLYDAAEKAALRGPGGAGRALLRARSAVESAHEQGYLGEGPAGDAVEHIEKALSEVCPELLRRPRTEEEYRWRTARWAP